MRWTLQLLADRLVALTRLEGLSYEAVRLVLKKRSQTLAASEMVYSHPPDQARHLTKPLEFHYTPEHSSWLNMAEVEISVLTEQC